MDEGSKVKINTLGIERYGSDNRTEEVGCNEIVGMIYRDGSLQPYEPVSYSIDGTGNYYVGAKKVWVHKTTHQNNVISLVPWSVQPASGPLRYDIYWAKEEDFLTELHKTSGQNWGNVWSTNPQTLSLQKIAALPAGVTKIDFVNNILVYSHTAHLFINGAYTTGLDVSNIQFKMDVGAQGNGVALMYDSIAFSSTTEYVSWGKYLEKTFEADDTYKRINADFGILQNDVKRGDYISGACFMRYAIKLYDGSYIHVSNPVLIMPDTYYSVQGEDYGDGASTFTYNSNPIKFALCDSILNTSPKRGLKDTPQLGLIQSMFGSACYWTYISLLDQGGYISCMQRCVDTINSQIDGTSATPTINNGKGNFYISNYYLGTKTRGENFQPVDLDYWLLAKGHTGFREIIQFNNTKFRSDKYYGVISSGSTKSLQFFDYTNLNHSIQELNYNKGWTWGAIPFIVPRLLTTDNLQSAELNGGVLASVFATTCSPFIMGQDKLHRTSSPSAAPTFTGDLCKFVKEVGSNNTFYPWNGFAPIVLADNFDASNSWFTTRFCDDSILSADCVEDTEHLVLTYGETAKDKRGFAISSNHEGCIFKPLNEHIGELGFGVINTQYYEGGTANNNATFVFGRELYSPVYRLVEKFPSDMKDLISSIDIFITPMVDIHEDYNIDSMDYRTMAAHRPYRAMADVKKDIGEALKTFYKIHSIPYEEIDLTPIGKTIMPYLERGKIATLESQDLLQTSGDDSYDYKVSYVYNDKLHIAQITENIDSELYSDCNTCINLNENPRGHSTNHPYDLVTQSQLHADNRIYETITKTNNNYQEYKTNLLAAMNRTMASGATLALTSIPDAAIVFLIQMTIDSRQVKIVQKRKFSFIDNTPLNPCFYYPNAEVDMAEVLGIEIYDINNSNKPYFFNVTNKKYTLYKDSLAIASYYIDLKNLYDDVATVANIATYTIEDTQANFPYKAYEDNNSYLRNMNLFKVSAANQPLVFPLTSTYNVGYGKIIAFSSYATATSQGQFGEYPLLVFTTEGIFAMQVDVNGIGTYLSNAPFSREVCCNPNSIVQVDGGVFFASDKGLMFTSGKEVILWSEKVNGEPRNLPNNSGVVGDGLQVYYNAVTAAVNNAKLVSLFNTTDGGAISQEDFRAYISDSNTYISYLYVLNKLLCYNTSKNYVYLINLTEDRLCTKLYMSGGIRFGDDNYPSELFVSGQKALDFTVDGSSKAIDCLIQTRPIMIDTNSFKSSYRVVLRGMFNLKQRLNTTETFYHGLYILGSLDSQKWMYIGGTELGDYTSEFTINDIGTTIERMSIKYLMAIYVGKNYSYKLDGSKKIAVTRIDNLEISTNEKYNDKTR